MVCEVTLTSTGCILHIIATHVKTPQVLACLNKAWAPAVKAVRTALKTSFLNSDFTPVCLGFPWCDNEELEEHLQTVVGKIFGMLDKDDDRLWWYRTEMAWHHAIRIEKMSFQDV